MPIQKVKVNPNLIRMIGDFPKKHLGPESGGRFFALEGFHDLPIWGKVIYTIPIQALLDIGSRIYMQNAEIANEWIQITHESQLPKFEVVQRTVPAWDGYGNEVVYTIKPFMPEFYVKPFGFKELKLLRKLFMLRKSYGK